MSQRIAHFHNELTSRKGTVLGDTLLGGNFANCQFLILFFSSAREPHCLVAVNVSSLQKKVLISIMQQSDLDVLKYLEFYLDQIQSKSTH